MKTTIMRAVWRWLRHLRLRLSTTDHLLQEFQVRFPGRCPICSYHRFGLQWGATTGKPPPHDNCPEVQR